ncbi:MAG: SpoIVB peptidase [Clostridiales bacterium]|nr:SpoIVB peptidase [Roseburia sp.]MDD7635885.1 SpoIVB peptidase [Clostridiales bacterium]MDY4111421.1 SpoIVB peptidase [Roseburia sp.]
MSSRFYQTIQQVTWIGAFLIAAFAVKTFLQAIPDELYVTAGQEVSYEFDVPVSVVLKEESAEVFDNLTKTSAMEVTPSYTVTCKLFGIFPIKDVEVMLVDEKTVYASGLPIGIYVKTDGVLVLGTSKVTNANGRECYPAQNLVKSGDYIVSVNGEPVYEKEELTQKIDAYGEDREILGIKRNGEYIEVSMTPVESEQGRHLLGIWVRDDLAGVGTMTYHTSEGAFGALGHAVSDGDTGTQMSVSEGWIYETDIVGIKKGENGTPGELSGVIDYGKGHCLGTITENSPLGIQGKLEEELQEMQEDLCYEVCYKQDIRIGTAYIISAVSGEYKKYEIQIESLDYSGNEENKGILFRVTDPELLDLTGGIVQGMSGSPIIQDGKIIGAVTHVFVSDASRGYGIFIEKMLEH